MLDHGGTMPGCWAHSTQNTAVHSIDWWSQNTKTYVKCANWSVNKTDSVGTDGTSVIVNLATQRQHIVSTTIPSPHSTYSVKKLSYISTKIRCKTSCQSNAISFT